MAENKEAAENTEKFKQPDGIIAFEKMKEKISRGELESGQSVRESILAKEFGLSRDAVRIALNLLVGWNILEYEPFCGYKVKTFTSKDIFDWYELRSAIEPAAARRLAIHPSQKVITELKEVLRLQEEAFDRNDIQQTGKYDEEFHRLIIENCGNVSFMHIHMTGLLGSFFFRDNDHIKNPNMKNKEESKRRTLNAHRKILEAIENCDPVLAERESRKHCEAVIKGVIQHLFLA